MSVEDHYASNNVSEDGAIIESGVLESYNGSQPILTIPKGVIGIAMCALMENQTVCGVQFPDTVSIIDDAAFCNCTNLEGVFFSDGLLRIGRDVFFGCRNLQEITFPKTLMHIGEYAFAHCDSIKSIHIPRKTIEIAPGAFCACHELCCITVDEENEMYVSINNHLYDILEEKLLAVPGNITDVCVSKSTKEILDFVYSHCYHLEKATIPKHIRTIGNEVFSSCLNLREVSIESGVEKIGKLSFVHCKKLKYVVIPDTVTFIGEHAFKDCSPDLVIDTPYNTYAWNYAKKYGITLAQKEPSNNGKVNPNNVYQILEDIHNMVSQTNTRAVRIEDKLDGIIEYIEKDLSSVISSARKKVQSYPKDDEAAVADFIESTSTYINRTIASPDALVEQETEQLKLLFGKSWNLLLPASKASLISAGVLWKSCARITKPGFDFSGVCISATSALEMELKHIFYSGFQAFLEERYGIPTTENSVQAFKDWPEILLSCSQYEFQKKKGNATLTKGNYFTLGKLPYILGKPEKFRNAEKENLLRTRLVEYLSTIVIDKYSADPISAFYNAYDPNCFVNKCEFINNAYRIKAAHTDVIEREQADDCYQQVIGKVDALKYTSDVTGLIIELYDMLK